MRFELAFPIQRNELASLLGISAPAGADCRIGAISTDSRLLERGDLFVALRGKRTDGHAYLAEASASGAAAILAETAAPGCFTVPDTGSALLRLAAYLLSRNRIPVVAITGSVGKTGTKDAVAAALSPRYRVHKTADNQNNALGVAYSLLSRPPEAEALVLELGTNHPGEIAPLSMAIAPDIGIVTVIGKAHIGAFGSQDAIFKEKSDIVKGMHGGQLILNLDDPYLSAWDPPCPASYIGTRRAADFFAKEICYSLGGTRYMLKSNNAEHPISLRATGRPALYASLFAMATAHRMNVPPTDAARALASMDSAPGRQTVQEIAGITLIDDSYNASPEAVAEALSLLKLRKRTGACHTILGDMRELGEGSVELHEEIGALAAKASTRLYVFGEFAEAYARGARNAGMAAEAILLFDDAGAVSTALLPRLFRGDTVLIKASHSMGAAKIAEDVRKSLAEPLQ